MATATSDGAAAARTSVAKVPTDVQPEIARLVQTFSSYKAAGDWAAIDGATRPLDEDCVYDSPFMCVCAAAWGLLAGVLLEQALWRKGVCVGGGQGFVEHRMIKTGLTRAPPHRIPQHSTQRTRLWPLSPGTSRAAVTGCGRLPSCWRRWPTPSSSPRCGRKERDVGLGVGAGPGAMHACWKLRARQAAPATRVPGQVEGSASGSMRGYV